MIAYIREEMEAILAGAYSHEFIHPYLNGTCLIVSGAMTVLLAMMTYYYGYKYRFWSKRGLKNAFPLPLVGDIYQILTENRVDIERESVKKYGKIYGTYTGTTPKLVVADADVLRDISIKDFHIFPNHFLDKATNEYHRTWIFFMKDSHWKRVRSIITPTFTSGKIKRMFKMMNVSADELMSIFNQKVSQKAPIDTKTLYALFTMDIVSTCLYAIKLLRADNSDKETSSRDSFVRDAKAMTAPSFYRILVRVLAPNFLLKWTDFTVPSRQVFTNMEKKCKSLIETRRRGGKKVEDFLQLLMDARLNDDLEVSEMDDKENHHVGTNNKEVLANYNTMTKEAQVENHISVANSKNVGLSELEIIANAMFFVVVGHETTASLLSHCTYALAHHPDIQQKLYEEILTIVEPDNKSFDYDKVTSAVYLDAVISETLRLMPPIIFLDRVASEDYHIKKYNVTIPKGTVINLAFFAVHHDPEYWPEPEKFDPSRFLPENRHNIYPGSYTPFGQGPRHCIGMRFSLTESKLVLAKLLLEFEFTPTKGSPFPPEPNFSIFAMSYKNLHVLANKRVI